MARALFRVFWQHVLLNRLPTYRHLRQFRLTLHASRSEEHLVSTPRICIICTASRDIASWAPRIGSLLGRKRCTIMVISGFGKALSSPLTLREAVALADELSWVQQATAEAVRRGQASIVAWCNFGTLRTRLELVLGASQSDTLARRYQTASRFWTASHDSDLTVDGPSFPCLPHQWTITDLTCESSVSPICNPTPLVLDFVPSCSCASASPQRQFHKLAACLCRRPFLSHLVIVSSPPTVITTNTCFSTQLPSTPAPNLLPAFAFPST